MRQRIRGRVALETLVVMVAAVVALSVSSTGSAAQGRAPSSGAQQPRPSQRIFGVVPAGRAGHRPRRSDFASSPFANVDNLSYHGGPVMHTNTVYAIYWVPPGYSVSANYQSLIDRYFGDVAVASGASSNVYASDTQYSDSVNGNILYSAATPDTFGGSVLDTNPLPPDGCSDAYTDVCLSDTQLQAEIQRVAAANNWTPSPTTLFMLMTADGIGSCVDDGSSGICAFEYYCAYHSNLGTGNNELLYANIPYADSLFGLFCDAGPQPNGDDADATINLISHEHNEAITDELGNAWFDSSGAENGDKCAWDFGSPIGSTAFGQYNQLINGHPYMLQQEWSNASSGCVLTYQQSGGAPPPSVTSTSPSALGQGAASQNITVTGSNFTSGAAASFSGTGITVNSTTFVDSSHVTANVTVATSAATGARNVAVTNPGGANGSCTGCFSVSAGPMVSSTTPSSLGQGATSQNVTVVGANFANGATASFSGTGIAVNSTSFVDAGHLTANVTISASAPAGARNLTVTNPGGGGSGSCSGCFSVTSVVKTPTITSFSPNKGRVGTAVTINGTNFTGVTFVYFNGTSAVFQTVSTSKITAIVPNGATTGKISVVAAGGTATSSGSFRVR